MHEELKGSAALQAADIPSHPHPGLAAWAKASRARLRQTLRAWQAFGAGHGPNSRPKSALPFRCRMLEERKIYGWRRRLSKAVGDCILDYADDLQVLKFLRL